MKKISLDLPTLFGDHHVTEVRRLLLELPGVAEVYASSSFQIVEVVAMMRPGRWGWLPIPVSMRRRIYSGVVAPRTGVSRPIRQLNWP